ncbi:dihydrofolate reductase [Catellicoccus marimammalium]|uniref:Dihydrofolate reductase n=1 Tax=Catellicoccus marimammalium M35/04/3 TaxID=1234409 RepID=K8ZL19_9ENTE|nr:dihydrofolate reductase [Catellicoccus marimammalium]EKU27273.1 Dihydrofolate reductase [Catellicoccus marimammalium M35/04/3]
MKAIWAEDNQGWMGYQGKLPWHVPEDLRFFKEKTSGNIVIMGRKTWEGIGHPLPNRVNIILSRTEKEIPGCLTFSSIKEVLSYLQDKKEVEVYVIGGKEIFEQFFPYCHTIYRTIIHHSYPGDVQAPHIDNKQWERVEVKEEKSQTKPYPQITFETWQRKRSE